MNEEDSKKLVSKYFLSFPEGIPISMHDLFNYNHTYSSFVDCEACGSLVNIDYMLRHAEWHETLLLKATLSDIIFRETPTEQKWAVDE